MNNMICRRLGRGVQQLRPMSSNSNAAEYIPGRKGYAPGFQAPEGTRESTKVVNKRREIGTSLPSHLPSSSINSTSTTVNSDKQKYRQALKATRHKYAQELLAQQGQTDLKRAEKLALMEQVAQQKREMMQQEKEQQKQHEQQVIDMLHLKDTSTRVSNRGQQRIENRLGLEQEQREERRKQLLKLYASTDKFVTLDNLDQKVDQVISNDGRKVHEDLNELLHNTKSIPNEIESRKQQLKEVMGL